MKTALFTNFSTEKFVGYWNGKGKTYLPGKSEYMPDYLAAHYAKHLTNRELLRTNLEGSLIYENRDKMTSPKNPEQVPLYMELYNKAYTPDEIEDVVSQEDDVDTLINVAQKNRKQINSEDKSPTPQNNNVIPDNEEEFAEKPIDNN